MAKLASMWARGTALVTAALGLILGGCSSEESDGTRYIRRFLIPDPGEWKRQSVEPAKASGEKMEIWEVSEYPPGAQPTPEQREAADQLIARCEQAVQKHGWEDFETAQADGFKLGKNDRRHYYNEKYIFDDRVLDPDRPEFLMYYQTPQGKRLVGFMFYVDAPMDRGPQIGGPLTVWHYHLFSMAVCPLGLAKERDPSGKGVLRAEDGDAACALGPLTHRSREMIHVWLIGHPRGPFATRMSIPPRIVMAELAKRDRALEEKRQKD